MDAFDVFGIGAEVGCVVDLVLEQLDTMSMIAPKAKEHARETYDARCFIGNEVGRLDNIIRPHEKITVDRPGQDSEHEITSRFEALVARHLSPHLQGVCEMRVLGATLFIFPVGRLEQAFGERMAMIPVEHAGEWEESVVSRRRRSVTYQHVDPWSIQFEPRWVQIRYDGSSVDEVPYI